MPTLPLATPVSRSSALPEEAAGAVIDMPADLPAPRLRSSEGRDKPLLMPEPSGADQGAQRVIVLLDAEVESLQSAAHLLDKHPAQSAVVTLRSADEGERFMLSKGEGVAWDGARVVAVGHGGAAGVVLEQMRDLSGYLKSSGYRSPSKLALLCCDAAAAQGPDDVDGTLLDAVHGAFSEAGFSTVMSGYSGGVHVGEDGRRIVADAACRKLTLMPNADGSVARVWREPRHLGVASDPYLGKGDAKGKRKTEELKQARAAKEEGKDDAAAAAPAAPKLDRRTVGRFLGPVKKAIRNFANTPIGKLIEDRLKTSDLAHRMSFEDIKQCVDAHAIDSQVVQELIETLAIPARAYGGVPPGDRQYYDYVMANIAGKAKAKAILIELLNSSPYNLRPGDAAENRALGQAFDPNLEATGRKSPLSQSLDDFGKRHPGIVSPPKEFAPGKSRFPDNVDANAMPEHRSSTSLKREELRSFEADFMRRVGTARLRKYSEALPFRDLAKGNTLQ